MAVNIIQDNAAAFCYDKLKESAVKNEKRFVKYDKKLRLEAYWFQGILQRFPQHFHEYYVIGLVEKSGLRHMCYDNVDYYITAGDVLLFNPCAPHNCEPMDNDLLDLRCLNIKPEIMLQAMLELTGSSELPLFTSPVLRGDERTAALLRELHQMIMQEQEDLAKEEALYFLLEQLVAAGISKMSAATKAPPVQKVTAYLLEHYTDKVTLEELADVAAMNKYSLLRLFTKTEGITPYRYLETIRIGKAKELLGQGLEPAEVALMTGFTDQSHFSKFFKEVIGLTPGQYRTIFRVK